MTRCLEASEDDTLWEAARKKNPVAVLQLAAEYKHSKPAQRINQTTTVILKATRE